MTVLKGRGGETLALVPIYIEGKGPFSFALDTGASRSVVDHQIAAELNLPSAGNDVQVSGVGGQVSARPVRVKSWRVADIELPAAPIDALELSGRSTGLQGLLGSDMLSKFQVIHIDYKNQRLVFHPGPSGRLASSH
jgi:predicted aspartyl protease